MLKITRISNNLRKVLSIFYFFPSFERVKLANFVVKIVAFRIYHDCESHTMLDKTKLFFSSRFLEE